MPLTEGSHGTETDSTASADFCKSCFQNGAFTEPDITLEEMMKKSIHHMAYELKMNDETAEHLAKNTIPTLKRWRSSGH